MVKRAFLFLYKKWIQTLVLLVLVVLICVLEFSGILIYQSAQDSRVDMLRQIGATITISPNPSYQGKVYDSMSNKTLSSVLDIPHVMGYDASNAYVAGSCVPINFNNVKKHTGIDPYTQTVNMDIDSITLQDSVYIMGSNNIKLINQFRKHLSTIIAGDFPTNENQGLLISSELADANHLNIGDELQLQYLRGEDTLPEKSIKIVGIYSTFLKFEILSTNDLGFGIFSGSPYNQIFADYSTASSITGYNGDITFFSIYIESPEYIDEVSNEIGKLSINWDQYVIYNTTQTLYKEYAGQLNGLIDKSLYLTLFSMGAGVILFLVVITFWNKNHVNDMGILIALGESKRRIVLQKLFESFIIAVFGISLAILIGYLTVSALSPLMVPEVVSSNAANIRSAMYTGEYDVVLTLRIVVRWSSVLFITTFGFGLILISTLIPCYLTLRYNVRQIFAKAE